MPRQPLVLAAILLVAALLLVLTTASPWAQLDAPGSDAAAMTSAPQIAADAGDPLVEAPARASATHR